MESDGMGKVMGMGKGKAMEDLGAGEVIFSRGQHGFAVRVGYDNRSLLSLECCGLKRQEMKDAE